jgi:uncharacterized damage-inducible protein DinB
MLTPASASLLAAYNRWMNTRLLDAAGRLDHAALTADRGAFFGSLLGTLNHILVADLVWLRRFAAHPAGFAELQALAGFPVPRTLRDTLAPDLAALRALREPLDALIERWVATLTPAQLAGELVYANMAGVPARKEFGAVLLHLFNHQTHHRGQATTLLFQSGVDMGETDLRALVPDLTE